MIYISEVSQTSLYFFSFASFSPQLNPQNLHREQVQTPLSFPYEESCIYAHKIAA